MAIVDLRCHCGKKLAEWAPGGCCDEKEEEVEIVCPRCKAKTVFRPKDGGETVTGSIVRMGRGERDAAAG